MPNNQDLSQHSIKSNNNKSRPFVDESGQDNDKSDLSQYSMTDKSTDASTVDQSEQDKFKFESPIQSGTCSQEKELPVRRSPIGRIAGNDDFTTNGKASSDVTGTEYSFALSESKSQRSTSTPGRVNCSLTVSQMVK